MSREKLKTFRDLFVFELRDIYNAEEQLIEALPKMRDAASNQELKTCFDDHLNETKNQKERLEKMAQMLDEDLSGHKCEAMKGLIKEGDEVVKARADEDIRDAALIAAAQRVEHYEIAAYGTAVNYSQRMNMPEITSLLEDSLQEEKNADSLLNETAINFINQKAETA